MFTLYVDFDGHDVPSDRLQAVFGNVFRPAIEAQSGFRHVDLQKGQADSNQYRLLIAFQSESHQKEWVATELHQDVWPQIERIIGRYRVTAFESA